MLRVIEQTREEKLAMYMRLRKADLAMMLLNANEHLDRLLRERSENGGTEERDIFGNLWFG